MDAGLFSFRGFMPEGDGQQQQQQQPPAVRVNKLVESAIQRHGSAENALSVLMAQNVTLEDQATADRQTIVELRNKIPADGSVVLPTDRAKAFNAFESLKLTPDQVSELQKENARLSGAVKTHDIEKLSREGAPAIGFDPEATADLVSSKSLHLELREMEVEVDKNGKKEKVKQKVPFVRPAADEKAQLQPLSEYSKTLPAFEQRALKPSASTQETSSTSTEWPRQTTSSADGGSEYDQIRERAKEERKAGVAVVEGAGQSYRERLKLPEPTGGR